MMGIKSILSLCCDGDDCKNTVQSKLHSRKDFANELKKKGWIVVQFRKHYQDYTDEWTYHVFTFWLCPDCAVGRSIYCYNKLCEKVISDV